MRMGRKTTVDNKLRGGPYWSYDISDYEMLLVQVSLARQSLKMSHKEVIFRYIIWQRAFHDFFHNHCNIQSMYLACKRKNRQKLIDIFSKTEQKCESNNLDNRIEQTKWTLLPAGMHWLLFDKTTNVLLYCRSSQPELASPLFSSLQQVLFAQPFLYKSEWQR